MLFLQLAVCVFCLTGLRQVGKQYMHSETALEVPIVYCHPYQHIWPWISPQLLLGQRKFRHGLLKGGCTLISLNHSSYFFIETVPIYSKRETLEDCSPFTHLQNKKLIISCTSLCNSPAQPRKSKRYDYCFQQDSRAVDSVILFASFLDFNSSTISFSVIEVSAHFTVVDLCPVSFRMA
jgi:hypothetical protein